MILATQRYGLRVEELSLFRALYLDKAVRLLNQESMDYTFIISELRSASLFDLFRLRVGLSQQLEDPERIAQVRSRLRPGMPISYFDEAQNRQILATVIELHRTRLLVENRHDKKLWSIPLAP